MTELPRSIPRADGLSKRNGAGHSVRAQSFVHRWDITRFGLPREPAAVHPPSHPSANHDQRFAATLTFAWRDGMFGGPDVITRFDLIDRGVSDRREQEGPACGPLRKSRREHTDRAQTSYNIMLGSGWSENGSTGHHQLKIARAFAHPSRGLRT